MRHFFLFCLLILGLSAKEITPNDVYAQTVLIQDHVHYLLKHYDIKHDHEGIIKRTSISTRLKPRNAWQKSYEILVKINILRGNYNLARIEPVGMEPVEKLNPDMVYGQTQRILAELEVFEVRKDIKIPIFAHKKYKNKTPLDVYNIFSHVSASFDELNRAELSASYIFADAMRIYDDLSIILKHLNIKDNTIPNRRLKNATPSDSLIVSMNVLEKIKKLQRSVGIRTIDFSVFNRKNALPSDVYSIIGVIIAELQPIKAYIGLIHEVTPPARHYIKKVPADIEQLMGWNLRKINLIINLDRK